VSQEQEDAMPSLRYPIAGSLLVHVVLFASAPGLPVASAKSAPVPLALVERPVPKFEEQPIPEPMPAVTEPKVQPDRKIMKRAKPKAPKKEAPAPKEAEPPKGLSVDEKNTVADSEGPAVPAIEGGGNMFADPDDHLAPGEKTDVAPSPPPPPPPKVVDETPDELPVRLGSLHDVVPPYPAAAQRAEIEGQVVLSVYVGTGGRVEKVKLVQGLGYGCDEIAIEWAKTHWRFRPATKHHQPIATWIKTPIAFVLDR
jgi:protein TonB